MPKHCSTNEKQRRNLDMKSFFRPVLCVLLATLGSSTLAQQSELVRELEVGALFTSGNTDEHSLNFAGNISGPKIIGNTDSLSTVSMHRVMMKLKVSAFMVSAVLTTNSLKTVSFLLVYLMKMTDSVVSIASLTSRFHTVGDFCRHAMI